MIQGLLVGRFGLELTATRRSVPVYALVVAQGGPRLTRASQSDCVLDTVTEGCHSFAPGFGHPLDGKAVSMSDLAHYLENWTDAPVVDHTGVAGLFAMHSEGWRPLNLPPPPPGSPGSGEEFGNLPPLSAVLARSGLALRRQRESMPFYVVDQVHLPTVK